jgi:flagella basal body P-ring formation protein FlgA
LKKKIDLFDTLTASQSVEDNLNALSSDEEGIYERKNQDLDFEYEEDEISVPNVMNPQLSKSNTVDMISAENHDSNKIIYGRVNKSTHKTPFRWFENQHEI